MFEEEIMTKKIDFQDKRYEHVAIVGLGYVGLPLCIEFARKHHCVGFDVDHAKISQLTDGIRPIEDITQEDLESTTSVFSSKVEDLSDSSVFIVTVPTPIKADNSPDLTLLEKATEMLAKAASKRNKKEERPGVYVIFFT